jgi:ribonuclease III
MCLSTERKLDLLALSSAIGHEFHNLELLDLALRHASWAYEQQAAEVPCNERLEFLGDAVLELTISDYISRKYPRAPEGELSRLRASLVNAKSLSDVARQISLGRFLLLGKGEESQNGRDKDNILADSLEAALAAVYLDGGMQAARQVIEKIFVPIILAGQETVPAKDHKSVLQEKIQALVASHPQYKLLSSSGPDHRKLFQVAVVLQGKTLATGSGGSKKLAEQEAARQALENSGALAGLSPARGKNL